MRASKPPRMRFIKQRRARETGSQTQAPSKWERFAQMAANLTQPCLLLLGTFGYFYTVLPAFQLAQLQEQTAKLEIEKSASEKRLVLLAEEQAAVQMQTKALQIKFDKERLRGQQLAADIASAQHTAIVASQKALDAETKTLEQQRILDLARWELVLNDWANAYYIGTIGRSRASFNSDFQGDDYQFILRASKHWPDPMKELLDALDISSNRRERARAIPVAFFGELRERTLASIESLKCAPPDFQEMTQALRADIRKSEEEAPIEAAQELERTRQEFEKLGKRAVVFDGYLERAERAIRASKALKIKSEAREKLAGLRRECDEKAHAFLKTMAQEKGVKLL